MLLYFEVSIYSLVVVLIQHNPLFSITFFHYFTATSPNGYVDLLVKDLSNYLYCTCASDKKVTRKFTSEDWCSLQLGQNHTSGFSLKPLWVYDVYLWLATLAQSFFCSRRHLIAEIYWWSFPTHFLFTWFDTCWCFLLFIALRAQVMIAYQRN